jgi:arylsulfatase A-like enzyme
MKALKFFTRSHQRGIPLCLFLLLSSIALSKDTDTKPAQANVLFISIDDLNDWVGVFGGHPDVKTPNMDRFASQAVVFNRAYCPAPLCNASRVALMTGVRPSTSGVYHNSQPFKWVMPKTMTMNKFFMENGYNSIAGGKIYHSDTNVDDGFQDPSGWTEYFTRAEKKNPEAEKSKKEDASKFTTVGGMTYGAAEENEEPYLTHDIRVAEWAEKQLAKKHDKPFFLAVGFSKPHLPWVVPKKYFDMYPPDKITMPKIDERDLDDVPAEGVVIAKPEKIHKMVLASGKYRELVAAYLACVTFADDRVGEVLRALEKSPYANNTVVVIWGDHGWHLGEKLHWKKFSLWEESARCPLMIRVPKMTPVGAECGRPVNLIDLFPTLAEVCGLPTPPNQEGVSIVPLLKNPKADWDKPSLTTYGKDNHTVRTEKWRYIRYAGGGEELYDHEKDALEWTNLAAKPEFSDLKKQLAKSFPTVNAVDAPEDPNDH